MSRSLKGKMAEGDRDVWLGLSDDALAAQCRIDVCRGTGPGGQKRNKTSSAVRLTHLESGVSASNDESRSQHRNRLFALRTLRLHMALQLRRPPVPPGPRPGANSPQFFLWIARVLDALEEAGYRLADTAPGVGLGTAQLAKALGLEPAVWQEVNRQWAARGLPVLRM